MKVLLKILKKNVRNSIVCFMSTILAAIILFVFLGVKELVLGTMSMEERLPYSIILIFTITHTNTLIIKTIKIIFLFSENL